MLDTADKHQGSLLDHLTLDELASFIHIARLKGLLTGLAGSLKLTDIDKLAAINADYLGFRGALCSKQNRIEAINEFSVYQIQTALKQNKQIFSATIDKRNINETGEV